MSQRHIGDTMANVKNPELIPLFDEAKELLAPYSRYFTVRRDEPGYYDLWSEKEVVIADRKRKEVFFASLIIQKSYVGFYYMPVYTHEEARSFFGSEMLALLKGKSCFYLKRPTPELREQMVEALRRGHELYVSRGWA
jgi:hypothetical protein